jgi:Flp pilus assembly pilin Flp
MLRRLKDRARNFRFWQDSRAQGLVEYVLLLALVASGTLVALLSFQGSLSGALDAANQHMTSREVLETPTLIGSLDQRTYVVPPGTGDGDPFQP